MGTPDGALYYTVEGRGIDPEVIKAAREFLMQGLQQGHDELVEKEILPSTISAVDLVNSPLDYIGSKIEERGRVAILFRQRLDGTTRFWRLVANEEPKNQVDMATARFQDVTNECQSLDN